MSKKIDRAKVTAAQKNIFEGELMLWNTRLDALVEAGDQDAIKDLLGTGPMRANNCGCNNGCDATPVLQQR